MLTNFTLKHTLYGRGLIRERYDAKHPVCAKKCGYGKGNGLLRHVIQSRKTLLVNLLATAHLVESHHLGQFRIVEIGHAGVIEGYVSILPDP